jgi:hypothetical protein
MIQLKWLLPALLFIVVCSPVHADTYSWEDDNGLHFTDNAETIPQKYRKKALDEARVEAKTPAPAAQAVEQPPIITPSESTLPHDRTKRVAKKAKQYHRGKMLRASETTDKERMKVGCYLHFSIQPGKNVPWNPASYQSGVMQMDVQTQDDCQRDCVDNAQQKGLDAYRGWILYGTCVYNGQEIWKK